MARRTRPAVLPATLFVRLSEGFELEGEKTPPKKPKQKQEKKKWLRPASGLHPKVVMDTQRARAEGS